MTDIVERLRSTEGSDLRELGELVEEAADEIERLRVQNDQMDIALKKAYDEIDRLTGWGLQK